jgi:hypothetical protein
MPPKGGILKSHRLSVRLSVCASPLHSCPVCSFVIHWGILKKLDTNVYHIKTMCRGWGSCPFVRPHLHNDHVHTVSFSCMDFEITMHKCLSHDNDVSRLRTTSLFKGQGHTCGLILKVHAITIRDCRFTHLCPDYHFVMHRRILK